MISNKYNFNSPSNPSNTEMTKLKELLHLIEKGDTINILAQEDLVEKLNELFRLRMIGYMDETLYLTKKGKSWNQKILKKMDGWDAPFFFISGYVIFWLK